MLAAEIEAVQELCSCVAGQQVSCSHLAMLDWQVEHCGNFLLHPGEHAIRVVAPGHERALAGPHVPGKQTETAPPHTMTEIISSGQGYSLVARSQCPTTLTRQWEEGYESLIVCSHKVWSAKCTWYYQGCLLA